MPRRREIPKREVLPDPKYTSQDVAKFINVIMTRGKKSIAEQIVYRALEQIKKRTSKDPLEVFNQAINNVKPMVEVKSRRVGGANYQVPVEVRPVRRVALAMRWLRDAARAARREVHGRAAGGRAGGGGGGQGRGDEEARGSAPHGGSEQGFLALPFLTASAIRIARIDGTRAACSELS